MRRMFPRRDKSISKVVQHRKSLPRAHSTPNTTTYLQSVLEQLVHARHLGRDAEVDGTVADLDNKTTADVWVDL